MNKQKIIETIESNKSKYGYFKKYFNSTDNTKHCTMGLLALAVDIGIIGAKVSPAFHTLFMRRMIEEYGIGDREYMWFQRQNDYECDNFDCMIEKIRGYKE
jgi:hypothetical protein